MPLAVSIFRAADESWEREARKFAELCQHVGQRKRTRQSARERETKIYIYIYIYIYICGMNFLCYVWFWPWVELFIGVCSVVDYASLTISLFP